MSTGDKIKKGEESQLQLLGFGEIRPGRSDHHDATRLAHMPHGVGGLKFSAQEQKEIGKKLFIFECFLKFANPFEMELDLNFK
jgi:hypothetical protein